MADKEPAHRPIGKGNGDHRSAASKARDLIERGVYTPTPVGKTVFFLLRSLDPFLQYSILAHGVGTSLLHRVGLRTLPRGVPSHTGISLLDGLGLSPYRLILLGMTVGSTVKQNIWLTALSADPMNVKNATVIGAFNTVMNAINNYAFLLNVTSASTDSSFPQPTLMIGGALYTVGILTELISEIQRYRFKKDKKNMGKPCTSGLWAYARHINYGGYVLWRAGYAMAAGGWILGALVGSFHFFDFAYRGVPILDEYCAKRYGSQWEGFKRDVKNSLIPFVY